jgi:hypothetical protein
VASWLFSEQDALSFAIVFSVCLAFLLMKQLETFRRWQLRGEVLVADLNVTMHMQSFAWNALYNTLNQEPAPHGAVLLSAERHGIRRGATAGGTKQQWKTTNEAA